MGIQIKRIKNENYTVISNVFLRDKRLSCKAKGFLAVIMGLPDDWDFSINGIVAIMKEGVAAVQSTIKELEECGYCTKSQQRDKNGVFAGFSYVFSENPYTENPHTENPHTENPHTENPLQLNTYSNKVLNKIKNEINKDLSYDFGDFWNDYDKKVGNSEKLMRKWQKLTDGEKQKIREHIPIYKQSQPDKKYRKNPETYINNKSWNDEIIISQASSLPQNLVELVQ